MCGIPRGRWRGKADGGAEPFPLPSSSSGLYVLAHEPSGTLERRAGKSFNMMEELYVVNTLSVRERGSRRA